MEQHHMSVYFVENFDRFRSEASKVFQRGFTDLAMSFASLDETL